MKGRATTIRTLSFGYDLYNHLTSASDPAATFTFTVDGRGQVREEVHDLAALTPNIKLTRTIDTEGRQTQLQTWLDTTADLKNTYTFDAYSRVTSLKQEGNGGNEVAEKRVDFTYNVLNQFDTITRYADVSGSETVATSTYTYDGLNRLLSLTHADPSSTTLAGYEYEYDAASRITEIDSFLDGLTTYSYDVTNQLASSDHTGQSDKSYDYDLNGNREMSGYVVGANNRISTDGTYNYAYDDEGNLLSKTKITSGEKEEYTWDHRNRLVTIKFKNSAGTVVKQVDQTYDVFNRWIGRSVDPDGTTGSATIQNTYFAYDGNQILFDFDGPSASDLTHRYLWGPVVDQLLAAEDVTSLSSAGNVLYPLGDHLNSNRDIADYDSGTQTTSITNHRRYEDYGALVSETNSAVDLLFGWTGRPFDDSTGLQNNSTRWYMPDLGEWMSEDWIGFLAQDVNISRYISNQPTVLVDPSGLAPPGTGFPITLHPNPRFYPPPIVRDLRAELIGRVGKIEDSHSGYAYFHLFHLDVYFDDIDEVFSLGPGVIENFSLTGSGEVIWEWASNSFLFSGCIKDVGDPTLMHEMTHMLDDAHGWYIGINWGVGLVGMDLKKIERLGYAAQHIFEKLSTLQRFEDNLKKGKYKNQKEVNDAWQAVWDDLGAYSSTAVWVWGRQIQNISDEDMLDFEKKTGVDISHKAVFEAYRRMVEKAIPGAKLCPANVRKSLE